MAFDWEDLLQAVGGWSVAGGKLKSKIGWEDKYATLKGTPGNGTNDYGFSALPGGFIDGNIYSSSIGAYATWWSATEHIGHSMGQTGLITWQTANSLNIIASDETASLITANSIEDGRSVRCVEGN